MTEVVLGLGSNRALDGMRCVDILAHACVRLGAFLSGMKFSSIYRSAAMYLLDQDDFYNMAVTGFFEGTPFQLLDRIHGVENECGRDRSREVRNGPRPLDIDIELFGCLSVDEPELIVPHERMWERAFVLIPVLEILDSDADVVHGAESFDSSLAGRVDGGTAALCRDRLLDVGNQRVELFMKHDDFAALMTGAGNFSKL